MIEGFGSGIPDPLTIVDQTVENLTVTGDGTFEGDVEISSGNLGIGAPPSSIVDVHGTVLDTVFTRYNAGSGGANHILRHSRGASVGTNTILNNGDNIATIQFAGANGTGFTSAAFIQAQVDGTPGASNDMPGRLRFLTTPDGSGTPIEGFRLSNDQTSTFAGNQINQGQVQLNSYTVATLPSASNPGAGSHIFVTDETGGATGAYSDGTNWRRYSDRAVVS